MRRRPAKPRTTAKRLTFVTVAGRDVALTLLDHSLDDETGNRWQEPGETTRLEHSTPSVAPM
ncbi:MAG: hypothetical protein C4346_14485, partial [Chloroflexota bacterium]